LSLWVEEKFTLNAAVFWQTQYTRFKSGDMQLAYSLILSFYNIFVMFGTFLTLFFISYKGHEHNNIKILSLYFIGSVLLFMVLESAGRYKGAYYSQLTLLAMYGFFVVLPYIKQVLASGNLAFQSFSRMAFNKHFNEPPDQHIN
jgi:predicted MFS family arabinose efflux permease